MQYSKMKKEELEDLKSFEKKEVLRDIDFTFDEGKI